MGPEVSKTVFARNSGGGLGMSFGRNHQVVEGKKHKQRAKEAMCVCVRVCASVCVCACSVMSDSLRPLGL